MSRLLFLLLIGVLGSLPTTAYAQRVSVLPGVHRLPNDLTGYLEFLQDQQLASLERFSEFLKERVKEKKVPEGAYLNFQAVYLEAQVHAERDPQKKQEKLKGLTKLYEERKKLDSRRPNATWFGVDRVKIGDLMKSEFEAFRRLQAEELPKQP